MKLEATWILRRITQQKNHVGTAALVSSSTTWFTFCSDTSFTVLGSNSIRQPTLHGRGALAGEIEFADHGAAVIHQHPLPDSDYLHRLCGQGQADVPAALGPDLALAADFHHAGSFPVLPRP